MRHPGPLSRSFRFLPAFFLVALTLLGCPHEEVKPDDSPPPDPCAELTCGANAVCQEIAGTASCACTTGYEDCNGVCIATGAPCGQNAATDGGPPTAPPTASDGGTTPGPIGATDAGFVAGVCEPGDKICVGPSVYTCASDGSGHAFTELCMDQCVNGACTAPCGADNDKVSYLGCSFWATRLENSDLTGDGAYFSLSISSQGNLPIDVTITDADNNAVTATCNITPADGGVIEEDCEELVVQPGGLLSVNLSDLGQVEGTGISRKAYRINTTGKVSVHQFNPVNNLETHSSDATLLLPASALGTEYRFVGWPSEEVRLRAGFNPPPCDDNTSCGGGDFVCGDNGYCLVQTFNRTAMSVIATGEGSSTLTIDSPVTFMVADDEGLEAVYLSGSDYNFTLNQGDILTIATEKQHGADLSGLFVTASQKIAVFSSNPCAMIPHSTYACDHIEQQLPPLNTWGNNYVIAKFTPRGTEPDIWRVVASSNGTTLTSVPAISALDGVTLGAGDSVQFEADHNFTLQASSPVAVAQFMVGSDYPGGNNGCGGAFETSFPPQSASDRTNCDIPIHTTCNQAIGDPALLLNVPTDQYRKDYTLLVPFDYLENYVSALMPTGIGLSVEDTPIDEAVTTSQNGATVISSTEIEGTDWRVVTLSLGPGVHRISAADEFGLIAYGYDCTVSYAYPGGLNLTSE